MNLFVLTPLSVPDITLAILDVIPPPVGSGVFLTISVVFLYFPKM